VNFSIFRFRDFSKHLISSVYVSDELLAEQERRPSGLSADSAKIDHAFGRAQCWLRGFQPPFARFFQFYP